MDMVGFDEEYMTMTEQKCARLKSCNKEKVVYLASKVEEKVDGCRMLCIIDRDWDTLFSKESMVDIWHILITIQWSLIFIERNIFKRLF